MLSGVRLRLRTSRAAFRSESFFSGDPPDSGAGLGVSTSSSASGAADSASGSVAGATSDGISASTASVSGSVAGTASGAPGSAMTRSILVDSGDDELAVAADLFDFPAVRGDLGYDDLNLIASDFHHDNGSDCDVARVAHTYLLLVV